MKAYVTEAVGDSVASAVNVVDVANAAVAREIVCGTWQWMYKYNRKKNSS